MLQGYDHHGFAQALANQSRFLMMEPTVEPLPWPGYLRRHRFMLDLRYEEKASGFWARAERQSMLENNVAPDEVLSLQSQIINEKLLACVKKIDVVASLDALDSWFTKVSGVVVEDQLTCEIEVSPQ